MFFGVENAEERGSLSGVCSIKGFANDDDGGGVNRGLLGAPVCIHQKQYALLQKLMHEDPKILTKSETSHRLRVRQSLQKTMLEGTTYLLLKKVKTFFLLGKCPMPCFPTLACAGLA